MDNPEFQNQPENFPSAPPPPQEVKIRTMRSDLASMAQSGGGLPQFQNVRINEPASEGSAPQGGRRISLGIAIAVVIAILILTIAGYFAYQYFGVNR
jgi:hypothetical protein